MGGRSSKVAGKAAFGASDTASSSFSLGSLEAWICASCGLTEWYAKNVGEAFERIIARGRKVHVRVVERAGTTPFR